MVTLASLSLCNSISPIHFSIQSKQFHPISSIAVSGFFNLRLFTLRNGLRRRKSSHYANRLRIFALTEGSANKKSKEVEGEEEGDPSVPSWAKPGSDEPPPWARNDSPKDSSSFELPFFVYLLASAITAIAAIGSIFEYVNQKPVFGVLNSDSVFYTPLLGFFAITGIPSSLPVIANEKQVESRHSFGSSQSKLLTRRQRSRTAGMAIYKSNIVILEEVSCVTRVGWMLGRKILGRMAPSLSNEAGNKDELPKEEKAVQRLRRAQWLRAAILGANDGLLSTASLMLGIGAAREDHESMFVSGVAGALADGEFSGKVGDTDSFKLQISAFAHPTVAESGKTEENSGTPAVSPIGKLMSRDHEPSSQGIISPTILQLPTNATSPTSSEAMKDISNARVSFLHDSSAKEVNDSNKNTLPNPYKAGAASALSFLCGSLVPIAPAMVISPNRTRVVVVIMIVTSIALALFGGLGAFLGGLPLRRSSMRVLLGGWISMAITYGLLKNFDKDDKIHAS
ncbi:hypothetical protein M9H77_05114 [Catharanthus roseus]|uniref:Uncharacterized protein n=1 Tax=Catharanthus roseus TaxID=4058 RepID=A0ACC0CG09_CATRO|nr:hypothetical protein M9H77_05114 [Catharanthus roseus]